MRELRLVSHGPSFGTIVGSRGSLRFAGRRGRKLLVHSWDAATGAPDADLDDGRGSVAVRRGAVRLDASDTSFEDLGFVSGRFSGVAITAPRVPLPARRSEGTAGAPDAGIPQPAGGTFGFPPLWPGRRARSAAVRADGAIAAARRAVGTDPPAKSRPTGTLVRSRFVRNVFGAYAYEAYGMRWIDDEFLDNVVYGLDPHDNSDGFLVAGNLAARNGRHGIIVSRFCDDNVIRDNRALHNGWHGIVIDDGRRADGPSDRNVVLANEVRANGKVGISIDGSSDTLVADNRIEGQRYGIRVFRRSRGTVVRSNEIVHSTDYGVLVNGARRTVLKANVIADAATGVRLHDAAGSVLTRNTLVGMRGHGVDIDDIGAPPAGVVVAHNDIAGRGPSPIRSDLRPPGLVLRGNRDDWRYPLTHAIAHTLSTFVGPGMWLALLLAVLFGPMPWRLRRRTA